VTNSGRALIGAGLVAVGTILLADAAGTLDAGAWIRAGWPVIFVFLGAVQIAAERHISMVAVGLITAGGVALAVTTGVLDADVWSLVWPALLIAAGVWLVVWRIAPAVSTADEFSRLAVFAPGRVASRAPALRRVELTAVFSSLRLDLVRARLDPGGARIAATSVFGGIVILVPEGWRVTVRGLPIFGGWDDTTSRVDVGPDAPALRVQALTFFGGIEVRHPRQWA
jgi:hypothetical protein